MRLLELFEQSGKTAAVAFGRMNPPTIGHQKVVDAILKQKADAHFLFVSQTHKPTGKNKTRLENPLPFDVKLGFIEQAFPNIDIGDTSVGTAIGILQNLEKQGFENVIFVCGSDRVAAFTELFNKQNGIDYNLKSIKIESSGARDPDAEGAEGMSASKMRAAAIVNDFELFKTGLPAGLSGDAEEVFSAVRQGLEPWLEQGVEENSLNEFDPGEDGFGPFKVYVDDEFLEKFATFDQAKEEIEFLRTADPKSFDADWKIIDGTGKTVWQHDPGEAIDAMRMRRKIQFNKPNDNGVAEGLEFFSMPLRMSEYRGKHHPATNEPYDSKFKFSGDLKDRVHGLLDAGTKPTLLQVNPRHLLATQDWLSNQGGGKPPFATMKQHPVVLQKNNKLYILDGHHRSADALNSGTPIQVYLFKDEL